MPEENLKINRIDNNCMELPEMAVQIKAIYERLVAMERSVNAAIPRTRRPKAMQDIKATSEELLQQRVSEVARIFDHNINLPAMKRREQGYPSYLLESGTFEGVFGAMTESILVNRLSLRKIFQPVIKYRETTAMDNARDALKEAVRQEMLHVVPAKDAFIPRGFDDGYVNVETLVVLSNECWERLNGGRKVKKKADPNVWVPPVKKVVVGNCDVCGSEMDDGMCGKCRQNEVRAMKEPLIGVKEEKGKIDL